MEQLSKPTDEVSSKTDMPFLSIITRDHPGRSDQFERCRLSVEKQKDRDFQHIILYDEESRGVPYANRMFFDNRYLITGKYVFMLDSDDILVVDTFVEDMKQVAKEHNNPDIIFIRMIIEGKLYPTEAVWRNNRLKRGCIGGSCFIMLNKLWQENIEHFESKRAGDFTFISTVISKNPTVYWQDEIYSKTLRTGPSREYYKTSIISRAIYDTFGVGRGIGILTRQRLKLMQRYFINSLRNQTDLDFTLYIVVGASDNEATVKIKSLDWGSLNVEFVYTNGDLSEWRKTASRQESWGMEIDKGSPESILSKLDHPNSAIMARLDNDDWVAPGWIAHMKHMAETKPESHFLINYQLIGQGPDGRLYEFFASHTQARTSPFIALVQKKSPRISPYAEIHKSMGSKFATVYNIPPSYVFMVIHGENRNNRVYQFDKYFDDVESQKETIKKTSMLASVERGKIIKQSTQGTDWRARIAQANAL